jgi:hypothetical protein
MTSNLHRIDIALAAIVAIVFVIGAVAAPSVLPTGVASRQAGAAQTGQAVPVLGQVQTVNP